VLKLCIFVAEWCVFVCGGQIENCAGEFPLWLAPVQIRLLPVKDSMLDYCLQIQQEAQQLGLRVEVDTKSDRLPKQIRNAEQDRIPLMCVVGEKEKETSSVAVRTRAGGDVATVPLDEFLKRVKQCVEQRGEYAQS
jgi:threonyl-tRNA synthetase